MTSIVERVEREELKQQLAEIVEKLDPIPAKMTNNYLKKTDINNFDNYKSVITQLKANKMVYTGTPADQKHTLLLPTPFMNQRISK
jgi:hypothetical protein